MAQRIYWQYKDDDSTFDLNRRQVGIIHKGRYKGFGLKDMAGGPNVLVLWYRNLTQETGKGIDRVNLDLSTDAIGVWVTPQGAVVTENDAICIPFSDGDATYDRIDVVVGTHNHVESPGGIAATYSIVQGIPDPNPVAPNVLDDTTDVVIGYLYVAAGTVGLDPTSDVWTPARIPDFADDATITHLDKIQKFAATQFMHSMYMDVCFGAYRLSDSSLHLGIAGSFFSANFPANQDGEYYVVDGTTTGTLPTGYVPVEAITFPKPRTYNPIDPPKAQRKVVVSSFPIELIPSNYLTLPNNCPVRIESNEPFILEQVLGNSNLFGAPSDYAWYLVSGGQVNKGGVNKVTGLISHAYETATVDNGTETLPRNDSQPRNIIRLTNTGLVYLSFIQSQFYTQDGGFESGTTLTIYPNEGSRLDVLLETVGAPTPPLGYKPIRAQGYAKVSSFNTPLIVQEMDDYFQLLNMEELDPVVIFMVDGVFSANFNTVKVGGRLFFAGTAIHYPSSGISANAGVKVFSFPTTQDAWGNPICRVGTGILGWAKLEEYNSGGSLLGVYDVRLDSVSPSGYDVKMTYHPALVSSRGYFLYIGFSIKTTH